MQVLTVTLQRVFDVQRYEASEYNPRSTHFSIVADGDRHFAVRLPGWPRLQVGDRVTVVLEQAGNWQTLRGWKNHSSEETLLVGLGGRWAPLYGGVLLAFGLGCGLQADSRTMAAVYLGACVWGGAALLHHFWHRGRVRQLLESR